MKIVVVSDTHGDYKNLNRVYLSNQDADIYLHLGDYEVPEYLLNPFSFVKGNCDFLSTAPNSKDLDFEFGKIHMEHGDRIPFVIFEDYVESKNCKIFLFGHTHKKCAFKIKDTYVFNPGSLTKPRDSDEGSYLIIYVNNDDITYEFKELDD